MADFKRLKRAPWGYLPGDGDPSPDFATESDLAAEVRRCREKFPGNGFLLAALMEEAGELADAILENDAEHIRLEAIQVACVALRIAEEGDATTYQPDGIIRLISRAGTVARWFLQKQPAKLPLAFNGLKNAVFWLAAEGDASFDTRTDEEAKP